MTLMVGVSGIRGIVGQTMTPATAARAGLALAEMLRAAEPPACEDVQCDMGNVPSVRSALGTDAASSGGSIVLGRDGRPSGPDLMRALIDTLNREGFEPQDLGIVPTPTVGVMVCHGQARAGVVITASHNPAEYNGIKFITPPGRAPDAAVAELILNRFRAVDPPLLPDNLPPCKMGPDTASVDIHVGRVLATVDVGRIRQRSFHVAVDSVHASGGPAARRLLGELGCRITHLSAEPTGAFPHAPEPVRENLTALCACVEAERVDVGFAQDPDADRLAIVDQAGRYIGEEFTLALGTFNILHSRPGVVVTNLSTSRMVDDVVRNIPGCSVVRSAVGEANVVSAMLEHDAVVGGEGNGGLIDPRVGLIRDSLSAMAQTLDLLARSDRPLSDIVAEFPDYRIIKDKIPCDPQAVGGRLDRVAEAFASERIDRTDGLRVDRGDGWFHVRGSNTEPIIRIIAESTDASAARRLVDDVRRLVE